MKINPAYLFTLALILPFSLFARQDGMNTLVETINKTIAESHAKAGVGILGLDFDARLLVNDDYHYPMQSVYKLPLAMAILHLVDAGKLSLSQEVKISRQSLDTATWSPLVKYFPKQDIKVSLAELLRYTISKSDNNGCDVLFRLTGGTAATNRYIHSLGVTQIAIAATEAEMKKQWEIQYNNWCRPQAMLELLQLLYSGKLMSANSRALLLRLMTDTENSPHRLKGDLPENAVVAHKTGTSNTNKKGLTAATNDAGIITLPNGKHLAVVVLVSDFKGRVPRGEQIIASVTRLIWDYYKHK